MAQRGLQLSEAYFARASGSEQNGLLLGGGLDPAVPFWLVVLGANLLMVQRGLSRGIEAFCRWAMPLMAVCGLVVLVRVLTLGTPDPAYPERNVAAGLGYLWNPDLSRLWDAQIWLSAAGQIFFSLSVGFGIIINYASYLTRRDDVVLSALSASSVNEVFEITFGGLITVTAAFVFLGASGAAGGTFALGFTSLPVAFTHLGAWERPIGAAWFFLLFLAAITSSLSMLQPARAFLMEALGCSSRRAVGLLSLLAAAGSFWVLYFSEGLLALDTMDFWVGTVAIFVLAGVEVVCFGWVLGVDRGLEEARAGALMAIPRPYRLIIKYVAPVYLGVVFAGFCAQSLPGYVRDLLDRPVALSTLGVVCVVFLLLLAIAVHAERRWDGEGAEGAPRGGTSGGSS